MRKCGNPCNYDYVRREMKDACCCCCCCFSTCLDLTADSLSVSHHRCKREALRMVLHIYDIRIYDRALERSTTTATTSCNCRYIAAAAAGGAVKSLHFKSIHQWRQCSIRAPATASEA
jgi:hypothetical protein